jgi:hypothetical protein
MSDKIHRSPIVVAPSLSRSRVTKTEISFRNELVPVSPAQCTFIACTNEFVLSKLPRGVFNGDAPYQNAPTSGPDIQWNK